jgi:hypothetical protein
VDGLRRNVVRSKHFHRGVLLSGFGFLLVRRASVAASYRACNGNAPGETEVIEGSRSENPLTDKLSGVTSSRESTSEIDGRVIAIRGPRGGIGWIIPGKARYWECA